MNNGCLWLAKLAETLPNDGQLKDTVGASRPNVGRAAARYDRHNSNNNTSYGSRPAADPTDAPLRRAAAEHGRQRRHGPGVHADAAQEAQ